jgi:hypothetical protein
MKISPNSFLTAVLLLAALFGTIRSTFPARVVQMAMKFVF